MLYHLMYIPVPCRSEEKSSQKGPQKGEASKGEASS